MLIYLLNIFLILLYGLCFVYIRPNQIKKAVFCSMAAFNWIMIAGLRNWRIGPDTVGYARMFFAADSISWQKTFDIFFNVYFKGAKALTPSEIALYKDPGYLIFEKIVHIFTDNYQIYLIIIASILFITFAWFIYKNSEDACFSFILFSTLFYSFYAITGIRQTIATSLIVFIGYEFIKQRKILKYILISLIAFTIHKSALVFMPFYFLSQKKINRKYYVVIVALTIFVFASGPSFILDMATWAGYFREEVYKANTYTYTALMSLIGIGTIITYKKIQVQGQYKNMEINATVLAVMFTLFTLLDQSMMRVQQYYGLFIMLSLPSILNCFDNKTKFLLKSACIVVLILLFINNNPIYMFFWQS